MDSKPLSLREEFRAETATTEVYEVRLDAAGSATRLRGWAMSAEQHEQIRLEAFAHTVANLARGLDEPLHFRAADKGRLLVECEEGFLRKASMLPGFGIADVAEDKGRRDPLLDERFGVQPEGLRAPRPVQEPAAQKLARTA